MDFHNDDESILYTTKRKKVFQILTSSDESDYSKPNKDLYSDNESEQSLYSDSDEEVYSLHDSERKNFDNDGDSEEQSEWCAEENHRAPFEFSGNFGQQFHVPRNSKNKCLFYLDKFFDSELISIIVEQTNLFATQYIQSHSLKKRSRIRNWHPTNNTEMKSFIALLILQGIVRKPKLELYFSKRESISTPFFSKVMSHQRFLLLCKFLHFEDNQKITSKSKVAKIETLWKNILHKCKSFYIPAQNICIDESLLLWKGRLAWKQYIPSKRSRFGMKMFVLCESQSGYIWNFCLYSGKSTEYGENYPQYKTTTRIVLELTHDLLNQGYKLYLDNWYTSIELAQKLCTCKTDIIGTIQQRRLGIPEDIKKTNLKKGEWIARYNNKIMLLKWRDKRDVMMISTIHGANMTEIEKQDVVTRKPEVICDYGKNMGGVDRSDGMIASYSLARKRLKKYYRKIFLHLLDVVCLNAYLLYQQNKGKLNRLNFLLECIEQIIEKNIEETKIFTPGRPTLHSKPTRLIGKHFPALIPST